MEINHIENKLMFYCIDVRAKANNKDKEKEIEQKGKNRISTDDNIDDSLNKFVHTIFYNDGRYNQNNKYYVIDNLQTNLIINEVEWHKDFAKCIKKEKIELQSREVLLLYQVFVTRILYMIQMNHGDNLNGYVEIDDLEWKFYVLCDEFVKAIPDFKTNDDVLNFLFGKMLDTKNCVDKNKDDSDIGKMKQEILDCVAGLLNNKNNDDSEVYDFQIDDKKKIVKTNSCCIISYENKIYDLKKYHFDSNKSDANKSYDFTNHKSKIYKDEYDDYENIVVDENYESKSQYEDDKFEFEFKNEKTKWSKDLGKEISLRQTEEIKAPNDTNYSKLEKIGDLLKNNKEHLDAIWHSKWGEEKKIENKTPISYKMLLPYLDKKNENADRNFEAILNCYIENEYQSKYLNPIIKVGIRSFEEIFMPNSVLKEYWTQKIIYPKNTLLLDEKPKDNFEKLIKNLKEKGFYISYWDLGIFKYKDEDGNFYTHHFALKNLGDFCEKKQIVDNYKNHDKYEMVIYEIKVKPEYENDFKSIKIKPDTFDREKLIHVLTKYFIDSMDEEKYQKDILNKIYYQCLKLIPIEQLLKTKIYDNTDVNYLCDFDMLNDINDKCENIEQMAKQIIKEAMRKNNAIKMDENNQLDSWDFNNLDEEEKDDYIRKTHSYHSYYYNIFEGNNLFEIISEKLKDKTKTIEIRSDNHKVIKAIFKTFKYKFDNYGVNKNKKNYFSQCCDLVKELCVEYENEKEFITYELFGTMLDHITDWFCSYIDIKDYATILFQLDDSLDNKNYKFTTDQQIGFLRCYLDKLNNANEKNKNSIRYGVPRIFEIIIQQHNEVKLDQKVIDYLFLTIKDAECLKSLLVQIGYKRYKFSLSLNVVERMFDLFVNDKNLQDDTKQNYLFELIRFIILNDNINFISDDKKQIDEIKDLKEEQRQIRLNFIKMYLEKINGNKNLISNCTLNAFFKYFDNSLDIKKEIANYIKEYSLKIKKADMWSIFSKTNKNDAVEIKRILLKGCLRFGKTKYRPKNICYKPKSYRRSDSLNENDYFKNYNNAIGVYSDYELDYIKVDPIIKDDSGECYRKLSLFNLYKNNNKAVIHEPTQKESFFNWSIYFAIALIVAIVILTFVFKDPLILCALLVPIIIFVYRFIKRCKKNNPEKEKPNFKIHEKDETKSLIGRTRNINLDEQNQDKKIILDENTNSEGYDNNLEEN